MSINASHLCRHDLATAAEVGPFAHPCRHDLTEEPPAGQRLRRAEAFLGGRKTATPEKFDRHVRRELAEWQEFRIRTSLGMEFRQTSRVLLVKPGWMPAWLFRRLLRSIVIEAREVESR